MRLGRMLSVGEVVEQAPVEEPPEVEVAQAASKAPAPAPTGVEEPVPARADR